MGDTCFTASAEDDVMSKLGGGRRPAQMQMEEFVQLEISGVS